MNAAEKADDEFMAEMESVVTWIGNLKTYGDIHRVRRACDDQTWRLGTPRPTIQAAPIEEKKTGITADW